MLLDNIKKIESPTWEKIGEAKAKSFLKESMDLLKVSNLPEASYIQKAVAILSDKK